MRVSRTHTVLIALTVMAAGCGSSGPDDDDSLSQESASTETTTPGQGPAASPSPTEAEEELRPATAGNLAEWFACQPDLPIDDILVYTAENDPNELLGRPGQYTSKATLADRRTGRGVDVGIDAGASIEVFDNPQEAQERADYVDEVTSSSPMFAEYHWLDGLIYLRVAGSLTPEQAEQYKQVLGELPDDGVPACDQAPAAQPDASPTGAQLPDTPQAYSSLYTTGDLTLPDGDGVVLTLGPPHGQLMPFIAVNRTGGPISRLEVSGQVVGPDGETIGSGRSQSIEPNVIAEGGAAIGYVFVGEDIPDGSTIEATADYTERLGNFENIVALDVADVSTTASGSFTGSIANPHDITVDGPISVSVACFDGDGQLVSVDNGFADRDQLASGETSTFTVRRFERPACDILAAGASGFDQ